MSVSIGELVPADWAVLRRLRLAALHETYRHSPVYTRELAFDEPQWRAQATTHPHFACLVDGEPVGLLAAMLKSTGVVYLYSMWIDPAARGQGLAGPLLEAAIAWSRARGAHTVTLRVDTDNTTARRLYETAGFLASPARPDDGADLEMTLRLSPQPTAR